MRLFRPSEASPGVLRIYFITGAVLVVVVFGVAIKRSCTKDTLEVEARQTFMTGCLQDPEAGGESGCEAFLDRHGEECIRVSIQYPGRYSRHEPFVQHERFDKCVRLGLKGYKAMRRKKLREESETERREKQEYMK